MSIKEPRIVNLEDYLSADRILMVPDYQRDYTWGVGDREDENQVVQLLEDLSQFVKSDSDEYLLGLITLADTDKTVSGLPVKYIVDGQQRTVTLSILLMCAYEYLQILNKNKSGTGLFYARLLKMFSVVEGHMPKGLRIRFSQEDSNKILQKVHNWSFSVIEDPKVKAEILERNESDNSESMDSTMENLLDAREYLSEQLHTKQWFEGDFEAVLEKIFMGVKFLELEISDGAEALGIYDKMNNRGLALSSADLIKNQLFVNVPNGKKYEEISVTWNEMSKTLKKHGPKKFQDPEFLVRSHAAMTWGTTVRESELAKKYQDYFAGDSKLPGNLQKLDPVAFVQKLKHYAEETLTMCSDEADGNELVFAARFLGAVQHFPLLLAADGIKHKEPKSHFLNQVGARALLQVLSKEHPPHVESIYPPWSHAVAKAGPDVTIEELNVIYGKFAFAKGDASKLTEKEIKDYQKERFTALDSQIDTWLYNSSSKRKIKAALALVSWWMDKKLDGEHAFQIGDYLRLRTASTRKKWDIDHILANECKIISMSDEQRNGIGNLVLLEDKKNKSASNIAPDKKGDVYATKSSLTFTILTHNQKQSVYEKQLNPILKSIGWDSIKWDLSKWSSESVISRTDFIKKILGKILLLM